MAPADLRAEAEAIVARMSLDERVAAVSGRDWWTTVGCARLGVPSVWLSDGPHGLRKCKSSAVVGGGLGLTTEAHCYPTAVTLGSSFDVDLAEAVGASIGAEAKYGGVGVVLGPGVNLKRSPLCGRNFEYLSEDPYVSGSLGAAWVRGCQRNAGVGASVKHFAANNQESNRMFCDSRVDARTLRELYLPAFEMVVKEAKPWTVMTAYNRLNGDYCSEHAWLLRRVLRDEWGFEGLVVSDWWAVRDRVKGVAAGMDLEMPTSHGIRGAALRRAVADGSLPSSAVDACAARVVALALAAASGPGDAPVDDGAARALARRAAVGGAVLLKNDGALPLVRGRRVAVLGALAARPRVQGNGSSGVNCSPDAPLAALGAYAAISHAAGYELTTSRVVDGGFRARRRRARLRDEALALVEGADAVVVVAGLPQAYESECYDRLGLDLPPDQDALIAAVAATRRDVVVVLQNGSPVAMPWVGDVAAVLEMYLAGEAGGAALADLLFGAANPGGKLAETFATSAAAHPSARTFGKMRQVVYDDRLDVGYRHFSRPRHARDVLFPFGHGLSYTTFTYGEIALTPGAGACDPELRVAVTNAGAVAGSEVVQLYVSERHPRLRRPLFELKRFAKLFLEPGAASCGVTIFERF